uniref:Uncharacterized protein n=1 Tax=Vespula pensylvanica TaxID=30213 RepID=A0A834U3Y5_VESPE|nr:hypothetical protein H0235_012136 [Vespula pensylvanica]
MPNRLRCMCTSARSHWETLTVKLLSLDGDMIRCFSDGTSKGPILTTVTNEIRTILIITRHAFEIGPSTNCPRPDDPHEV